MFDVESFWAVVYYCIKTLKRSLVLNCLSHHSIAFTCSLNFTSELNENRHGVLMKTDFKTTSPPLQASAILHSSDTNKIYICSAISQL